MTAIDRTAYPRFRATLTPSELHEHFTPSTAELALAEAQTPDAAGKLAFLTLYKCMQTLNYFPSEEEIPPEVIAHLRWYLQVADDVPAQVSPRSHRRYAQVIRQAIGLKHAVQEALQVARAAMEQAAQVRDHPADLINAALEVLLKQWYEFPAFSALDRLAGTVRAEVNERWCQQILVRIPTPERQRIERLLETPDGASDYARLKETPKSATLSHLDEWFQRLRWLQSFGNVTAWIQDVPVLKIHHLAAEARALDVAEMRDHTLPRRITLVTSLLYYAQIQTRDELVTMLIKRVATIHHQAREHLELLLLQERATMESWVEGLAEITRSVAAGADDPTVGHVARSVVDRVGGPAQLLTTYETLATYHGNNYLPLMSSIFGAHRAALFRVLRALNLHSTSQDQTLVRAVAYVLANEKRRVKYLPPLVALDFASEQWQRMVRTKQNGKVVYDRARLEMCVFTCVANEFKSGDLALAGSLEYADLREQLLPWDQCEQEVADYCLQLALPPDGKTLVETLRAELTSLAEQVDRRLPDGQVTISDKGEIRLKRTPTVRPSKAIQELNAAVAQKLPPRSVLEILKNAHYYANWTRHFGPLSGVDPKLAETVVRYITVAFCYGCNYVELA